jgi:hypothetical protein
MKRAIKEGYPARDVSACCNWTREAIEAEGLYLNSGLSQRRRRIYSNLKALVNLLPPGWRKLIVLLEPKIKSRTAEHLRWERKSLFESRKKLVQVEYEKHKRKAPPQEWAYWPSFEIVFRWGAFQKFSLRSDFETFSESEWLAPLDDIEERVATWLVERKTAFKERLQYTLSDLPSTSILSKFSDSLPNQEVQFEHLDLALAVFSFAIPQTDTHPAVDACLVGWETAAAYATVPAVVPSCPLGAVEAAWDIVSLAGLNPSSALAKEMDAKNTRFICALCSTHISRGNRVYSWRGAV